MWLGDLLASLDGLELGTNECTVLGFCSGKLRVTILGYVDEVLIAT